MRSHYVNESIELYNLASLSKFVFFDSDQDPNGCFLNEDGHVVSLDIWFGKWRSIRSQFF